MIYTIIDEILKYNFLVLSIILMIPGILIYLTRRDLRLVIQRMSLFAIPFAFTEQFFYPDYWEPIFLWDLIHSLGFGVEDVLFVMGLSWFTTTSYPVFFRKEFTPLQKNQSDSPNQKNHFLGELRQPRTRKKITIIFLFILAFISLTILLDVPMIYASFFIMISLGLAMVFLRNDLMVPGLWGGALSLVIYGIICFVLVLIYPNIFSFTWKMENFSNRFLFGIPLEEYIYSFSAGFSATVFYPFVTGLGFQEIRN